MFEKNKSNTEKQKQQQQKLEKALADSQINRLWSNLIIELN